MNKLPTIADVQKVFEWVNKVKKYFEPFKPEFKEMRINYKTRKSDLSLALFIPASVRRNFVKIEIPAYQNFVVSEMIDESFSRVESAWQFENGKWIMRSALLPASERFLLKLRGEVPQQIIEDIVRIQPAQNRDQTIEVDKYWLDSMIRDVDYLAKIYHNLEVEDVDVGVNVGIERCFSSTFPNELKRVLGASRRWINAGHGHDRSEVQRAWANLKYVTGDSKIEVGDIIKTIQKLTEGSLFVNHLSVDLPYSIGKISREERFLGLFPEKMAVEATTFLTLNKPIATGYLTFKKKNYMSAITEVLDDFKK